MTARDEGARGGQHGARRGEQGTSDSTRHKGSGEGVGSSSDRRREARSGHCMATSGAPDRIGADRYPPRRNSKRSFVGLGSSVSENSR